MFDIALAAFGAVALLKLLIQETPFEKIKPLNCPLCMGFWISLGFYLLTLFLAEDYYRPFFFAFQGAGICWILYKFVTGEN